MTETEFNALAAQGYNRIPVTLETFADLDTLGPPQWQAWQAAPRDVLPGWQAPRWLCGVAGVFLNEPPPV